MAVLLNILPISAHPDDNKLWCTLQCGLVPEGERQVTLVLNRSSRFRRSRSLGTTHPSRERQVHEVDGFGTNMRLFVGHYFSRFLQIGFAFCIPFICSIGCRVTQRLATKTVRTQITAHTAPLDEAMEDHSGTDSKLQLTQASFQSTSPGSKDEKLVAPLRDDANANTEEFTLSQLVDEVLSVNPTLDAMTAAWQAAMQRIPQARSLEDPMLGSTVAPASLVSNQVNPAYVLEVSQKFPWRGKRSLRGSVAESEAGVASHDYKTTVQKLTEVIELEYWEYYSAQTLIKLNKQNTAILKSIRLNAENRYRNGLVLEQDVLQADVELANLEQRLIELGRMNRVAKGNLNTLLRRNPSDILIIASEHDLTSETLPELDSLIDLSVARRPEISAIVMQIRGLRTKVEIARQQFYPDTEIFYRHDTFWQPRATQSDLREQVGVRMNMPIYQKRLNAAVCEAIQQLTRSQAEYDQLLLDIQREVQASYERVLESQKSIELYSKKLIPTAEKNVSVVRANYDNSKSTFVELAIAQRQRIDFNEKLIQAQVELQRRLTSLRRVVGGALQ